MSLLRRTRKNESTAPEPKGEKRARPAKRQKGTLELCGYELMLRNGVSQVAPGLFSMSVRFGDITYQCAKKDIRENIYSTMSALYNYFNPDTSVQVTITNEPVPADEIGNRTFFPKSDPCLDGYVEEYNRILNDKMREGVSNLKRHRYLTFTTEADDVDAAIPKLARMRNDCMQALARIKSASEPLDGIERLRITRGLLNPYGAFDFDWDNLSQSPGARTLDFVAPMSVDFKPNGRSDAFKADGAWCCAMAIRSFGSVLLDDCLSNIVDLPMPLSVSLHLKPIPQDKAIDMVQGKIDWMDMEERGQKSRAASKGIVLTQTSTALRYSRADAEELLDFLRNKNERLFEYAGYVFAYAETEEELDERVDRIISAAKGSALTVERLFYRQQEGWASVLPFATNRCDVTRLLTSGQIAMQMPFASLEINQPGGIYLGQSKITNTLTILDRLSLPSPMGFDFGTPGTGKSNAQKSVWLQVRNRMYQNFAEERTTWLFIDEVQSLFKHPAVIAYFESFWAEGRKFGLVATGLSQNASFMLGSDIGSTMILNSDYLMLHKQSTVDRDLWAETLNLSDEEVAYIDDGIKPGDGLLVAGGERLPITNEIPKGKIYDLLTTKPSEVAALGGAGMRSAR